MCICMPDAADEFIACDPPAPVAGWKRPAYGGPLRNLP